MLSKVHYLIALILFFSTFSFCKKVPDEIIDDNDIDTTNVITTKIFPDNCWGVYNWGVWYPNGVTRTNSPLIKGVLILMKWKDIEPQEGVFKFDEVLGVALNALSQNDFYAFLKIWVGSAKNNAPPWIFEKGVPVVYVEDDVDPLGNPRIDNYFAYYFDENYIFYYHRLLSEFGNYVKNLPSHLRDRVLFIQSAEGSTGDAQPYKSVPIDPKYNINNHDWNEFRIQAWEVLKNSLTNSDGVMVKPILVNFDNEQNINNWIFQNLKVIGVKQGMWSHGYHISDTQDRLENWKTFTDRCKELGIEYFTRGEQDKEWETYGWSTQNPEQAFYWSAIFATHCGLDMWNLPPEACKGYDFQDAIKFFNRHAFQHDPATASTAFCALRKGLDASNTNAYPENIFGTANKRNIARYLNIAEAYKDFGAMQGDPEKAIGGGMVNRKREDYNDVGWKILEGNYFRYLKQIDPESTSTGWWHKGPNKKSIYSRFARSIDKDKGNTLYFDLDDNFKTRGYQIMIRIIYLDEGFAEWSLLYNADDDSNKTAFTIKNNNSGDWKEKTIILKDANFMNSGEKKADLIIKNYSDEEKAVFHMIEMLKI